MVDEHPLEYLVRMRTKSRSNRSQFLNGLRLDDFLKIVSEFIRMDMDLTYVPRAQTPDILGVKVEEGPREFFLWHNCVAVLREADTLQLERALEVVMDYFLEHVRDEEVLAKPVCLVLKICSAGYGRALCPDKLEGLVKDTSLPDAVRRGAAHALVEDRNYKTDFWRECAQEEQLLIDIAATALIFQKDYSLAFELLQTLPDQVDEEVKDRAFVALDLCVDKGYDPAAECLPQWLRDQYKKHQEESERIRPHIERLFVEGGDEPS